MEPLQEILTAVRARLDAIPELTGRILTTHAVDIEKDVYDGKNPARDITATPNPVATVTFGDPAVNARGNGREYTKTECRVGVNIEVSIISAVRDGDEMTQIIDLRAIVKNGLSLAPLTSSTSNLTPEGDQFALPEPGSDAIGVVLTYSVTFTDVYGSDI